MSAARLGTRLLRPAAALILAGSLGCQSETPTIGPHPKYSAVAQELERIITHEMEDKDLPALSIALVDNEEIVWATGFGVADPERKIPATAETVYRVGSVSKLFTDMAIMQLVESGEVELDAPVTRYLPEFRPQNPFGKRITLRQLMAHRSGLVREPPVGNYFDAMQPGLARTVQSLNTTTLVYEPETRTKYSNAGIGVVGYVLERIQGQPFAECMQQTVLEPLGLTQSAFEPTPEIRQALAKAYMWTYEGRLFEAPTFQLGTAPAGNLYSTVVDLSRFMSVLFQSGRGPRGQFLQPETLEAMWTPQYAEAGEKPRFGIGFAISEFEGHRRIGHGGAIYGFTTELAALPEKGLGVVAVTTKDAANSVLRRITDHALKSMLAVRAGRTFPSLVLTAPVEPKLARQLAGRYSRDGRTIDLIERGGKLFVDNRRIRVAFRSLGETLIVDDTLAYGSEVSPVGPGTIAVNADIFRRVRISRPKPAPQRWKGLIGEYGWDHNTLYVLEKEGKLYALIEWFFFYPLREISRDVFAFPDYGLYEGEKLVFVRDKSARATHVEAGTVIFERRPVGDERGATSRIQPARPVDELRQAALAAEPLRESGDFRQADLVDLSTLDPTLRFDIRYATKNNFMNTIIYRQPRAFLQRPAAEALLRAHEGLRRQGYGLLIHDAYRPWYVTKMFWDATPESMKIFVADPARGSRHNRGAAVDLTLYGLATGKPVEMVGGYDEFSPRSYGDYPGGTSLQRWHRELLREAMEAQGFLVYECEWWHFDHEDWQKYPILNLTFDQIMASRPFK